MTALTMEATPKASWKQKGNYHQDLYLCFPKGSIWLPREEEWRKRPSMCICVSEYVNTDQLREKM